MAHTFEDSRLRETFDSTVIKTRLSSHIDVMGQANPHGSIGHMIAI